VDLLPGTHRIPISDEPRSDLFSDERLISMRRHPRAGRLAALLLTGLGAAPPETDIPIALHSLTIIPAPGQRIENGTILIRAGRIAEIGVDLAIPPGVRRIDGRGLVAYAGFIDGFTRTGVPESRPSEAEERRVEGDFPSPSDGPLPQTVEANRNGIFARREVQELLDLQEKTYDEARQAGFTAALVAPPEAVVAGRAALLQLGGRPQRSSLLRCGVAQVASFAPPPQRALRIRGRYPSTSMGVMAHLRQLLLDVAWYAQMQAYFQRHPDQPRDLPFDPDLVALQDVLAGREPVFWEADAREEIERALRMAGEFGLKLIIVGGRESGELAETLRSREIPVILSARLPTEPRKYELNAERLRRAPEDRSLYGRNWSKRPFEPRRAFEEAAVQRKKIIRNAAALESAGVPWCFSGAGLKKPDELLKNIREMIGEGLSSEAALRALTVTPARLFGVEDELGTIAVGKRANLTLLSGPLEDDKSRVRFVFIDGREFEFTAPKTPTTRGAEADKEPDEEEPDEEAELSERRPRGRAQRAASQAVSQPADVPESQPDTAPATASAPAETQPPETRPADPRRQIVLHEPDWPIETPEDRRPALRTGGDVLLRNARVLTIAGEDLERGSVLVRGGRIAAIGPDLQAPEGVLTIDLGGHVMMPGIFDPHSHIALSDVNEFSLSVTPEVRVGDVIRSDDPRIYWALSGGCTSAHLMHGSANTIGGQCVLVKLKYGRPADELPIPGAVRTVKWALGENVIRSGKVRNPFDREAPRRFPGTRMGVEATIRRALEAGREYARQRSEHEAALAAGQDVPPLRRDLRLEALADILEGRIWVNTHCYRADEVLRLIGVAEEFGIRVAVLHHVLEGYRILPEIARHGAGTATFADWWAYKIEAYEAVPHNAGMLLRGGVNSAIKSDSADLMRHMNLEAAKCLKYAGLSEREALQLITLNPARQFGLEGRLGSIEVGKDADLAVFDGHPLDTFAKCVLTLVDGEVYFQHRDFDPNGQERSPRPITLPPPAEDGPGIVFRDDSCQVPAGARLFAIVGGRIHTVSGPIIEKGTVVIRDGRIDAVGADVAVPRGAQVIDASGQQVFPGLINAATQVGLVEIEQVDVTIDTAEPGAFQPDVLAVSGFNPHSAMVGVTRAEGITTVLLVPSEPTVAGQAGLLDLDGWTMDEALIEPRAGLVVNLPVTRSERVFREPTPQEEPERRQDPSRETLQKLERFFRDAKVYAEGVRAAGQNGATPPAARDPRFEAMVPYVLGEKPVLIAANSYQAILEALLFAEEFGLRAVLLGGRDAWKVADLLAARNVPVIYEGVFALPASIPELREVTDTWDANYRALSVLARAGVRFCASSRGADLAKLLPLELGFAVAHGLDPERALRAMTLDAAEILGVADRIGSIEPGKVANLVVATDHPCQATSRVQWVFIRGRPVPLENKHTQNAVRFAGRPRPELPPPRTDLVGPPAQTLMPSSQARGGTTR